MFLEPNSGDYKFKMFFFQRPKRTSTRNLFERLTTYWVLEVQHDSLQDWKVWMLRPFNTKTQWLNWIETVGGRWSGEMDSNKDDVEPIEKMKILVWVAMSGFCLACLHIISLSLKCLYMSSTTRKHPSGSSDPNKAVY